MHGSRRGGKHLSLAAVWLHANTPCTAGRRPFSSATCRALRMALSDMAAGGLGVSTSSAASPAPGTSPRTFVVVIAACVERAGTCCCCPWLTTACLAPRACGTAEHLRSVRVRSEACRAGSGCGCPNCASCGQKRGCARLPLRNELGFDLGSAVVERGELLGGALPRCRFESQCEVGRGSRKANYTRPGALFTPPPTHGSAYATQPAPQAILAYGTYKQPRPMAAQLTIMVQPLA